MTKICMIACVDENNAIGYENHLLYHLSDDLKQFKEKTIDKCVIMGRITLASLPGGKPLINRRNIVLSRTMKDCNGAEVYHCLEDVLKAVEGEEEVWVIGGESIYNMFLPYADEVHLTHVHQKSAVSDVYFPVLDDTWKCIFRSDDAMENGIVYHYAKYEKGTR